MAKKVSSTPPRPRFSADEETIMVFALRYALGRMSTAPYIVVGHLKEVWDDLTEGTQRTIIRDVEEEFKRDDVCRARGEDDPFGMPLGWDCDRQIWEELRKLWRIPQGQRTIYHGD